MQPYYYSSGPDTTDDDDDDDDDNGEGLFGQHFGGQNRFPGGNLPPPPAWIGQAQVSDDTVYTILFICMHTYVCMYIR